MIDQSTVNLLDHIPGEMKKAGQTNGGEWMGPCPFCGGHDRFRVWPSEVRFWCRQCNESGDAISLIRKVYDCDMSEALKRLGLQGNSPMSPLLRARSAPKAPPLLPSLKDDSIAYNPKWQSKVWSFSHYAHDNLMSADSQHRDYLYSRGITDKAMEIFNLGYNPRHWPLKIGSHDVHFWQGYTIPSFSLGVDSRMYSVNVRTNDIENRYKKVSGSLNYIFNLHNVSIHRTVVLMESELDAILLWSLGAIRQGFTPIATSGSYGGRLIEWVMRLSSCRVLVAMDNDEAGHKAANWWLEKLPNAVRVKPINKDFGDDWKAGIHPLDLLTNKLESKDMNYG